MNDTYIDTYNPVFEGLHQITSHMPDLPFKTEPVPQHTYNMHTAH